MEGKGLYCGVDEAGRGPVMGPMVVAAVYVSDDDALTEIGVRDSKKLTPKRRESMYGRIIDAADDYSVVVISAEDIDERRKHVSLNEIELDMFAEATSKVPVSCVYADCPDINEMAYQSALSTRLGNRKVIARHKADDTYPCVSAASIIAKVTRDRMIQEIREEFGEDIGSGYPSDPVTIAFIEKWIKDKGCAPKHTRTSWETVRRIRSKAAVRKLTDW